MKLAKYLKPYLFFAIISPILMIGEVMADLSLPKLMSYIVDFGIAEGGLEEIVDSGMPYEIMTALFGSDFTQMNVIITFGVMMLLIVLVGGFFGTMCAYTAAKASQGFGHDLRCDAYRRVMSLSIEQTDKFTTGSLVTRMTNDIAMLIELVEMILRMCVRSPMFLIGGTVMLLSLNLKFGVVLLCSLPLLLATLILVLSKSIPLFSTVQKKLDRVNSVVQENVSGARVVKAYVREDYETNRFSTANGELKDINLRVLRLMAIIHPVLNILQNLAIIAIILIGGIDIKNGIAGMSVGSVMAGITYVTQVIMSIMMVTMMFNSISRAIASGKRINEIMDSDPTVKSGLSDGSSDDIAVSFENVSFRYPGTAGEDVLHDINLNIKRGETLAIIGSTGCGKTSLVSLVPRFYDPSAGKVKVGGIDVKDYKLSVLRNKISYVMQKSELFSDTVANNIRWGKEDATLEEIKDAVETAQAKDFVENLPNGYDDYIAEKGASLSGGQKQRLSIARGVIRKPEILIFDDATSALDLVTEAKLRKALHEKMKDTTVIMIAQRIASVKEADRIAVIEDGTIKHCAPHEELMRISETYRDIYDSQMKNGGDISE
ncbi:MAG: ABC transporter ATP-binding protein [Clostridia bacterium]|nr:ABC transporter ATP-binding protein [Clostridia bacterium]